MLSQSQSDCSPELTQSSQWLDLVKHSRKIQQNTLADLFDQDAERGTRLNLSVENIYVDYAKNHLVDNTLNQLIDLSNQQQLPQHINQLFSNNSLSDHVLLRDPVTDTYQQTIRNFKGLSADIEQGRLIGASGEKITDVVHLGVGGSYLGPITVNAACHNWQQTGRVVNLHYAYAMDGNDLSRLLGKLNPHHTLFIIASKSFSTVDTLENASLALYWLKNVLTQDKPSILAKHFIAISACTDKMYAWGIAANKQLLISPNTVGRYSLWSNMGLPIALYIGLDNFKQLLAGAYAMDQHFRRTDFAGNIPVILGLISVWNHVFLGYANHIYLPYSSHLQYLPGYLQQLMMESLGKSCTRNNLVADYPTGEIVFGEVGFAAQHSFFQLLHQGTGRFACDFIAIAGAEQPQQPYTSAVHRQLMQQHKLTLANCFAQARILMLGSSAGDNDNKGRNMHKHIPGNKPSTTILLDKLTPFTLGSLLALYEHKTFVESVIYNIDPFSQDGVELGKKMARHLYATDTDKNIDSSSAALLKRCGFDY